MPRCSFTAWAPHSSLTKAKGNAQDGEGRRVQNGRFMACPHVCLKWQVWGTVLPPALQISAPRSQRLDHFPPFNLSHWACNTWFSAPFTLGVRDVAHWPRPQLCPFLASWLKLGATAGTRLPRGLLPHSRMVVRPLGHQACPWPWSQAKLQGQPASLGFMLHPACGPITATLIMQASKSCKEIDHTKEKRC